MVLRILTLQILNCYYFLLNVLAFFFIKIKGYWQFLIYFDSQMKIILEKKQNKQQFVDSGFVETCDEHFTSCENGYLFLAQLGF